MAKKLEPGFYWRGGVIWVRTDPVTGKPASTRCHDPTAAKLWRAQRERLAADPAYAASLTASVGSWAVKTLAMKQARKAEGTANMYKTKLGHVVRLFGADAPLASITAGAIDEYIATRAKEGVIENTIQRELTGIRQMLKHAKRAGEFAGDIEAIMPIGFSPKYKPVKRLLRKADFAKLWAALQTDEHRAWVCFALATGADSSDIERATAADYDPERRVIHIHGRKNTSRDQEIPIHPHAQELFEYALARLPVSWPRASKALGEACKRAGIGHLSPKDLRRTAGSWLVASGVHISLVSRFLRHGSDAMVRQVYGQLSPEELRDLLDGQSGTNSLQLPSSAYALEQEPAEKQPRPLGGIGRHEGFKILFQQWSPGSSPGGATAAEKTLIRITATNEPRQRAGLFETRCFQASRCRRARTQRHRGSKPERLMRLCDTAKPSSASRKI